MSCSPLVYGPFSQTMLLGCSIVDFSCSLGWNEQVSQLTVNLVQDTCTAPAESGKVCYDLATKAALDLDLNLNEVVTYAADPGFTEPSPGDPVYFRLGPNFEFCGIVQSWSRNHGDSNNPTYSVTLNDPRDILSECQLVLDEYVGGMTSIPNVFNIYGYSERFGTSCPDAYLTNFTGPGSFGGSQITSRGMSWNRIKRATRNLTSMMPKYQSSWSPYGRIRFMDHEYLLDWSELPYINSYRVQAASMSILDMISLISQDCGLDYYIELIFAVNQENPTDILNIIKVRTVSRLNQPQLGQIAEFVGDGEGTTSAQYGQELRNEHTSSVMVGGNKQGILQIVSNHEFLTQQFSEFYNRWDLATIWPYWGKHRDGGVIIGEGLNQDHHFTIDLRHLNIISEDGRQRITSYTIYIDELHAVLAGKDTWLSYFIEHHDDIAHIIGKGINPVEFLNLTLDGVHVAQNAGAFMPHDVVNFRKKNVSKRVDWQDVQTSLIQIDKLFRIIERYATEFYGQKFMVRMWDMGANQSYVCVNQDADSDQLVYSLEVTDGGWTDAVAGVLGIENPDDLDVFRLDDRRVGAFCRFNEAGRLLIPDIDPGDFVFQDFITNYDGRPNQDAIETIGNIYGQQLFTKCDISQEYVFISDGNGNWNYNDPRVVVTLPSAFHQRIEEESQPFFVGFMFNEVLKNDREWAGASKAQRQNILRDMLAKAGSTSVHYGYNDLRILPNAINIPMVSNVETYGPWFAYGAVGKTRYEKNDDLTPWNFGNSTSMTLAGTQLAKAEVSNMQVSEFGSVELPGLPALQLGAELRSGAASLNILRDILLSNDNDGMGDDNYVEMALSQWNGSFGPNITDIQVSVGRNGVTTRYDMRTFTPAFGRFAKQNAERLKMRGLLANKRATDRQERRLGKGKDTVQSFSRDASNQLMRERQNLTGFFARTPHQVLVGQTVAYSGTSSDYTYYRSYVHTQSLAEATNEMSDYENKHLMSLDGLLQPFSVGDFNYYRKFYSLSPAYNFRNTDAVLPPTIGDNYFGMVIDAGTLNPFLNPDVVHPKYPLGSNSGCGHNIEYVARDVNLPEDMCIHHENDYALDRNEYRGICLRGPLILKSWGFDTFGKPVPNSLEEDNDSSENFYDMAGQGTDQFMTNWLKRPDKWKTGPVDLRWDYIRGVWTAFPGFQLTNITICEPMGPDDRGVGYINGDARYDRNGEVPNSTCCSTDLGGAPTFDIHNRTNTVIYAGETVLCAWVTDRYQPVGLTPKIYEVVTLEENRSGGGSIRCRILNIPSNSCNPEEVYVDCWGVPLHEGTILYTYAIGLIKHVAMNVPHRGVSVLTDIDCVEVSGPNGNTMALAPCSRTVWVAGDYTVEHCANDPEPQTCELESESTATICDD